MYLFIYLGHVYVELLLALHADNLSVIGVALGAECTAIYFWPSEDTCIEKCHMCSVRKQMFFLLAGAVL
jgi:hypothetical protein